MKNIAIILAGGSGTRMGLDRPKQFLVMAGRTVLEHSVEAFLATEAIEAVVIVSNPAFVADAEAIVARHRAEGRWGRVVAVIAGGSERSDSSVNALRYVAEHTAPDTLATTNIILHDAVRPLVDSRIIGDVVAALAEREAVNVTLPVVDTIVRVEDGRAVSTVDRSVLQRVQTPQGFRVPVLAEAYRRALSDPDFRATDDCGVVMRYVPEVPIGLVAGSERNLKLTYRDDIPLFEFLLRQGAFPSKG